MSEKIELAEGLLKEFTGYLVKYDNAKLGIEELLISTIFAYQRTLDKASVQKLLDETSEYRFFDPITGRPIVPRLLKNKVRGLEGTTESAYERIYIKCSPEEWHKELARFGQVLDRESYLCEVPNSLGGTPYSQFTITILGNKITVWCDAHAKVGVDW